MAPNVPSAAQRRLLHELLASYPRQRSFEKQAREHESLKNLSLKIITAWYTEQRRIKTALASTTRSRPAPRPLVITSSRGATPISDTPAISDEEVQHLQVDVMMETPPATPVTPSRSEVVRPSPVRSPKKYSPTTLVPPQSCRDVVGKLESIVEQKDAQSKALHVGCGACLRLKPDSIAIGAWKRDHKPHAPLTVSIECSGAVEITTRLEDTIYRFHIPLSQLSHLTLQSSLLTLSLLLPPEFYQRSLTIVGEPKPQWKPCMDFTTNHDATHSSILLIQLKPNHPSTAELAHNPLLKPLTLILPPSPTETDSGVPTSRSVAPTASASHTAAFNTDASPTSRLFLTAHSQAVAQRAAFLQWYPLSKNDFPVQPPPIYATPHTCTYSSIPLSPLPAQQFNSGSPTRKLVFVSPEEEEKEFEAWYKATGGRAEAISEMEVDQMWSSVMDQKMDQKWQ